jgi:hypothetical protein|eukprot:COSAG01_NODE_9187_length_2527_cov_5.312191_3_plen_193_part_00
MRLFFRAYLSLLPIRPRTIYRTPFTLLLRVEPLCDHHLVLLGGGRPRSPSNTLRERGASILRSTHSPPLVVKHASTRGTAAPVHLGPGRGGASSRGSRHTPLGSCNGIASEGYRSGQRQRGLPQWTAAAQTAGACAPRRGAQNLLLGIYESLHNAKTLYFSPNINRVATSHLAVDLTGEYSGVSGRPTMVVL